MGKITLKKISKELLDIDNNIGLKDNFVGIGVQIDGNGVGYHSLIAIGVESDYYIFHFTSKDLELKMIPIENQKFHIKYVDDLVDPEFSVSFLTHCKRIMKFPAPQYGHIVNNAYYDEEGKYVSDNEITNFATCVGFCINVMKIFIMSEKYFEFEDWNADGMDDFAKEHPTYFDRFYNNFFAHNPNITPEQFDKLYKRITPSEYTASAYLKNLPIRKSEINEIIEDVKKAIKYIIQT